MTDVKTFVVDCFRTNWVFVKAYTDEGIMGVGRKELISAIEVYKK